MAPFIPVEVKPYTEAELDNIIGTIVIVYSWQP